MGLLTKDQNKRKSLDQILKMPYMQKFLNQNGNKIDQICQSIPFKKNVKVEDVKAEGTTRANTLKNS